MMMPFFTLLIIPDWSNRFEVLPTSNQGKGLRNQSFMGRDDEFGSRRSESEVPAVSPSGSPW